MINIFLDAITTALFTQFGDTYKYYVENVEQNHNKPCFTIETLNPLIRSTSPYKYHRTIPIVIHFFTEKEDAFDAKKDCYAVAERIMESLEYLPIEEMIFRGENIEWELVEEVLQFFITYNFDVTREIEEIFMEDGTLNGVPLEKG